MKNCLIIDCYDSFTYKLAQTIDETGLCNTDVKKWDKINKAWFTYYDAFVISPGPGLPFEYPALFRYLNYLRDKSVLGVCMGHQIIAEYCGAELYHTGKVYHGQKIKIKNIAYNKLFKDTNEFYAGLYHSWAVKNIPQQLKITSLSEEGIIMSLEHEKYNWYSIQFHPESFMTDIGKNLLKNWIKTIDK